MHDDPQLLELLAEWERREENNDSIHPEELTRQRPELLEPLRRDARVLRSLRGVLDVSAYRDEDENAARVQLSSPPGYRVVQVLGRGGMGVVYKAWQVGLDRVVALKMILAAEHADERVLVRFQAEAKTVARLQHPNIVQVFEVGACQGRPYIALEFLGGGNLEAVIDGGGLPAPECAQLVETLARAVHYAHEQGVIHRDLKPANILFTHSRLGPNGRHDLGTPKLVDFGLARQLDNQKRLTATGAILGTPCYMAPEQAAGQTALLGPAVDVYALGVILYELVTGSLPFDGRNEWEIIRAVVSEEPTPPSRRNPTCPAALEAVCLRCLHKTPTERYASAADLADDLRRYLAGEAVHAVPPAPPTPPRPPRRWARWLAALGGAALLALAVWLLAGWLLPEPPPLKLGVLASLSGRAAINGPAVVDAIELAILEINAGKRPLGRRIETVVADIGDEDDCSAQAEKLLVIDHARTIIGTWTSPNRRSVLPVLEKQGGLLIYPAEYEGLEASERVAYLGTVPNQTLLPALDWLCAQTKFRTLFVVGSDDVSDQATNTIIRDHFKDRPEIKIASEQYVENEDGVPELVRKISAAAPDLVLNFINGDANIQFLRGLREHGGPARNVPVMLIDCTEQELRSLTHRQLDGYYMLGSYFQSLPGQANEKFLRSWRRHYSKHRVTFDVMQAAYAGTHMWAKAVQKAGSDDPTAVRKALFALQFDAPEGPIRFDPENGHAWRFGRLARFGLSGAQEIVWSSDAPQRPQPFPATRSTDAWRAYIAELRKHRAAPK